MKRWVVVAIVIVVLTAGGIGYIAYVGDEQARVDRERTEAERDVMRFEELGLKRAREGLSPAEGEEFREISRRMSNRHR